MGLERVQSGNEWRGGRRTRFEGPARASGRVVRSGQPATQPTGGTILLAPAPPTPPPRPESLPGNVREPADWPGGPADRRSRQRRPLVCLSPPRAPGSSAPGAPFRTGGSAPCIPPACWARASQAQAERGPGGRAAWAGAATDAACGRRRVGTRLRRLRRLLLTSVLGPPSCRQRMRHEPQRCRCWGQRLKGEKHRCRRALFHHLSRRRCAPPPPNATSRQQTANHSMQASPLRTGTVPARRLPTSLRRPLPSGAARCIRAMGAISPTFKEPLPSHRPSSRQPACSPACGPPASPCSVPALSPGTQAQRCHQQRCVPAMPAPSRPLSAAGTDAHPPLLLS